MEYISPRGNKSGRTDEIIVDINNDGAPDGPTYINVELLLMEELWDYLI